ncbi:glycosyltransferase [Clostridium sp. Marseille-Q2269]|uniref:glycosyltransferase n=1 Tax=Clostridium sp. Marseille-Q2269 TaxID=2942205 RepID=UPI002073DC9A|nr:glycosyltransferase [Clostridium sp. Marseille-Q2269]
MSKLISVVIINYNSSKYIKQLISSLVENEREIISDKKIEVIIVDNNSTKMDLIELKKLQNIYEFIKIIETKNNNGFGVGNNIGVANCKSENILFLNADTYIIGKFIEDCLISLNKYNIGCVGVKLLNQDLTNQPSCGNFPCLPQYIFEILGLYKIKMLFKITKPLVFSIQDNIKKQEVDYVSGACLFIKKKTFNIIGGFDNKFFLYFEETDLCRRVKKIGKKNIIINSNSIVHLGSQVIGEFSEFKAKCFFESYLMFIDKFKYKDLYLNLYKIIIIEKLFLAKIKKQIYKEKYYEYGFKLIKSTCMNNKNNLV